MLLFIFKTAGWEMIFSHGMGISHFFGGSEVGFSELLHDVQTHQPIAVSRPPQWLTSSLSASLSTKPRLTSETQSIKATVLTTTYGKASPISRAS